MLVDFLAGGFPLASVNGAVLLVLSGLVVVGLGTARFLDRWRRRPESAVPNLARWACLVVGVGLWCSAPVVLLPAGYDWTDNIGGEHRPVPM